MNSSTEEQQQKLIKANILMKILKEMPVDKFQLPESSKENIRLHRNYLITKDYLQLDKDNTIFGLPTEPGLALSFSEKKAVREYIDTVLKSQYQPLIDFVKAHDAEDPFESAKQRNAELLAKVGERRELTQRLLELKSRKLELLKEIAEIRCNPDNKLMTENLLEAAKYNSLKTNYFEKVLEAEIVNSTTHAKKAIKEVEGVLDGIIAKAESEAKQDEALSQCFDDALKL